MIEHSEPALHAVVEVLKGKQSPAEIVGRIADIRDRQRVMSLIGQFKPDIVFHAAALKHVPMLEQDWDEGIKTNVFGSINVADAASAAGATAMVMISTDKAIEPVSVLGATKRLAEMYCQALDDEFSRRGVPGHQPMRLISVRFAERIIRLSGLEPGRDIQISYTGIRPGERLNEILFARGEETSEIGIPGIVAAKPVRPPLDAIRAWVATLEQAVARGERAAIYNVLRDAVPEFRGEAA